MIAIVGAGITGLALAHYLSTLGVECIVLEAAETAGGAIRTVNEDGRVLELGPQRMRTSRELDRLIGELGLEGQRIDAPAGLPLLIYHARAQHRVPMGLREAVRGDLVGGRGQRRPPAEPRG